MANIYFELTREFNAGGPIAVLASGQAVVYYRISMMSKDGDWILHESDAACSRVLETLERRRARYRPGSPLDVRWLSGGWSSHFEFQDPSQRRVRCDFFSRAPRVGAEEAVGLFEAGSRDELLPVVDLELLIRMKQTQRAKDYPVIAELARLLPPEREIELTTDPDRILALAPKVGRDSARPVVRAALARGDREGVVVALAREIDGLQRRDRKRVQRYISAAQEYLAAFRAEGLSNRPLLEAHERACALAEACLPPSPTDPEDTDADAE